MAFSPVTVDINRERNLSGGLSTGDGLQIISPESIAGTSATVYWTSEGIIADTYNIRIGSSPSGGEFANSGDVSAELAEGGWTFRNMPLTGTLAWVSVAYKFGNSIYTRVTRSVPVTYVPPVVVVPPPVVIDPDGDQWDDTTVWNDSVDWSDT